MEKEEFLQTVYTFLASINIDVTERKFDETTFLPGLKIENGTLVVNKEKLVHFGDILHEAGHIAVTVSAERNLLNDNVTENNKEKEGEELAAMLWSYAACMHLKVSPEIVFHKEGYKGEAEWLLKNYRNKEFIGLPLLVWMGMATADGSNSSFPEMKKWVRD